MSRLPTPREFLEAARVPETLAPQVFGPWSIERYDSPPPELCAKLGIPPIGWDSYTLLYRATMATLHQDRGECVMEDSQRELSRHLPIWLRAHGRVLVSGLGLGCVVRGLLASPDVEHIDVVEIDRGILDVVGPEFAGEFRVTLHHGDALKIDWPASTRWDFAWHDIWCEGGGKLHVLHAELMARYARHVPSQGAWMFPRFAKRRFAVSEKVEVLG